MKLYEILGVGKDANKEEVKKAYRKKSKETHPDAGGKQEDFFELTIAYKILSDDDKRSRYDNGEPVDDLNKKEEDKSLVIIAQLIQMLFQSADLDCQNAVELIKLNIANNIVDLDKDLQNKEKIKSNIKKFLKRLKVKNKNQLVKQLAESQSLQIDIEIGKVKKEKEHFEKALKIMEDYDYDYEQQATINNFFTTATTTFGAWR